MDFEKVVNDDIRYTPGITDGHLSPTEKELRAKHRQWLREPEQLDRWHDMLVGTKQSVEAQLAQIRAETTKALANCWAKPDGKQEWFSYKAKAEDRRHKIIRFKTGVEARLRECLALQREINKPEAEQLIAAIQHHREAVQAGTDDQVENADEQLWEVLSS